MPLAFIFFLFSFHKPFSSLTQAKGAEDILKPIIYMSSQNDVRGQNDIYPAGLLSLKKNKMRVLRLGFSFYDKMAHVTNQIPFRRY